MPSVSERFGCVGDGGCDSTFASGSCERSSIDIAGGAGVLWERRFGGGWTREALEVRKLILELEVRSRSLCGSGSRFELRGADSQEFKKVLSRSLEKVCIYAISGL